MPMGEIDGAAIVVASARLNPQERFMSTQIFVNLPVADLPTSIAFFTVLGYRFDARFTDANATCMVIEPDHIYAMLLVRPFFQGFIGDRQIADATTHREAIVSLACAGRAEVEATVAKAQAMGAATPIAPKDYGFMYQHGFEDPDGHQWEYFWMDPNAPMLQGQP